VLRRGGIDGNRRTLRFGFGSEPGVARETVSLRGAGIRHQAEIRLSNDTQAMGKVTRSGDIQAFYDFKALMRSPTSR
jgi:hypothetical protein